MLPLYLFGIQGQEWVLILVAILLLFGASKIPDLARSMGRAKGEYKKGLQEGAEEAEAEEKKADAAE